MLGTHRLIAGLFCILVISLATQALAAEDDSMGIIEFNGLEWYVGPNNVDWMAAMTYCENLAEDGGGWRMPTLEELRGLYTGSQNKDSHHSLPEAFMGKELDIWYAWSGETRDDSSAWSFSFSTGEEDWGAYGHFGGSIRAFAVRSPR